MKKTSTGIQENVAGLLCYLGVWVAGLVFILLETENKFVRFHAMQSIIVFGSLSVLGSIFIPFSFFLWPIVSLIGFALWIVLMVKAYQGEMYKLPWVGNLAEQWSSKIADDTKK